MMKAILQFLMIKMNFKIQNIYNEIIINYHILTLCSNEKLTFYNKNESLIKKAEKIKINIFNDNENENENI